MSDDRQTRVTDNAGDDALVQASRIPQPPDVAAELAELRAQLAKLADRIAPPPSSRWSLWRAGLPDLESRTKFALRNELEARDSAVRIVASLSPRFAPDDLAEGEGDARRLWEKAGLFYLWNKRYHEALSVFSALYDCLLETQDLLVTRLHKGMPLCWISDCYWEMGFPALAKRYLMLTLCEDAISHSAQVQLDDSGVYLRMVWRHGMTDDQLRRYFAKCHGYYATLGEQCRFPERVVQELDQEWMTELPASGEAGIYAANRRYISQLMKQMGADSGKVLELLAQYLLSCMPGCRTRRRVQTHSTDLDIVCSVDGFDVDFRSELGRYFVCECKDWGKPADFTAFAKFSRVLDSVKARFGILFSREGLSGEGKTEDAEREQLKVFQDRGMVILVVDKSDLEQLAQGANFTNMLRNKYERVRLDLSSRPQRRRQ
jgi:hypothetical protein